MGFIPTRLFCPVERTMWTSQGFVERTDQRSLAMTLETENRNRQSLHKLLQARSRQCAARDEAGDRRPVSEAGSDAVRIPATLPRNDRAGPMQVEALVPQRESRDVEPADDKRREGPGKSMLGRRPLAFAIGAVLFVMAATAGYLYWDYTSHFESTDDAFIAARQFAIAPKVPGYITAVPVTDNEHVVTGQVIARIDERDYRNALAEAEAQVAAARASIETIDAQIGVQHAQIRANVAQLHRARAALLFARQQATRYRELAATAIAGTVQDAQRYTSQLYEQVAARQRARANVNLAQQQIAALQAQRDNAVASLARAKAQRDQRN
jgi:membrane fusion protein (multidrug efflux system)